ncbi:NAD(P)-dependent alcohol dehydrogenase [Ascidiimonas sp. W6]|uniref:NAD(P)-dependent alcohol dehydrogenase n=1 Tax=Ascidiimonas meishanensis TaxID=3128903 RepID=UPI0030ED0A49
MKKTMKAAVMLKKGSPSSDEVLVVKDDVQVPTPRKGEILIKVAASSVNPVDWKMIKGIFPLQRKGLVGVDASGTVVKIAEGTQTDLKIGDKVYGDPGETMPGSFAEYLRIRADNAHRIPKNLDFIQAASLPAVGLTAVQGLLKSGNLISGNKICINGGSGGVGSIAIQVAKAMGAAEVWATGSSVEFIKELGADKVINYKEESVFEALKGQEFDIIFDTVGGLDPWKAAKKSGLKKGGKYVTTAGDGDDSILRLIRNWSWRYLKYKLGLGPYYTFFRINTKPPEVAEDMKKLSKLVESGHVRPIIIPRSFELNTKSLHAMMEASMSNRSKGKLVMQIDN